MSNPRTRMAAVAGGLALSLSLASAPAVMAQDGPEATVEGLLAAIEAKDFEAIPSFFCAEFADQADAFDLSGMTEGLPPGVDPNALLDAIILDTEIVSSEVVSQTDTEAVVMLEGSLSMDVDPEALLPFVESLVEVMAASGVELPPEAVEQAMDEIAAGFEAQTLDIAEEITLVPGESMAWVVCDELGAADEDTMGEDDLVEEPTDDAMAEDEMTEDEMAEDEMTEDE